MFKKIFLIFLAFFLIFFLNFVFAASGLIQSSDTISLSWPNNGSNHTIAFTTNSSVPAGGKIEIEFAPEFTIPDDLNWTDLDLNIAGTERVLGETAGSNQSGVEVLPSLKKIIIHLAGNLSINSQTPVVIKIGQNATYQNVGDKQVVNPASEGSFAVNFRTLDQSSNLIDRSQVRVAILNPVSVGTTPYDVYPPVRYGGRPSGVLALGTTVTQISLYTHEPALCKYETIANVPYQNMRYNITTNYVTYHATMITGLQNGMAYTFYIKCIDAANNANTDDYLISFSIQSPGEVQPGPGPSGPGGPTFPPYPSDVAEVVFQGWAYYLSDITILKDGKIFQNLKSNAKGEFFTTISNIVKGVYTFGLKAKDSAGRESVTYSITITLRPQTRSTISGIFIPPTIQLSNDKISPGDRVNVFGEATPQSFVEVQFSPSGQAKPPESEIKKATTTADLMGKWKITFDTSLLKPQKTYDVKARSFFSAKEGSDFSKVLYLGVGVAPTLPLCARSDLNKDGKVNLTDFSILLYWWNTANETADINMDGKVNLTDFSIMLYCWTG